MYVMFILMAFSLTVSLIFLGAYVWSVKSGQFDDKYTPSVRMLFEDKKVSKKTEPGTISGDKNEENK
ncbi:MAG: cbb3-type cytochrome oxidase assembly protein CcoS [Candidatus Marinimicrobia bacterium]|nr:cbb3-type cytochrome oxidase assembly protein CcoS [Candidatus Neomarinimicrobiota bacterium]MBT3631078.1 cbb3-type cytochrome oxidase assembly protein CcoS [Candidatus Neomarinimicrobiota bacterium]MBT3825718.1 cbb3-type cytochrome oxidase assembly protein CcoS [Candidatus Neomarinimicrobiota bacterium]MBT4130538.1 cbb3-type cytochrome oxidase assembly protein CcoS [Candidatus Neomarinimicrobiota bacterium]MBT4296241.1 cbb3-type cytochrome oxidase assembly protein CcoS [Candidatus Neomarini